MLKVNDKNTRTTPLTLFPCFYCLLEASKFYCLLGANKCWLEMFSPLIGKVPKLLGEALSK